MIKELLTYLACMGLAGFICLIFYPVWSGYNKYIELINSKDPYETLRKWKL